MSKARTAVVLLREQYLGHYLVIVSFPTFLLVPGPLCVSFKVS